MTTPGLELRIEMASLAGENKKQESDKVAHYPRTFS